MCLCIYTYIYVCIYTQVALVINNLPVSAGNLRDSDLIPGLGRSPGGGHGNPLQYSCLENPMDRGAWWATVHSITKSWTWLKLGCTHTHTHTHPHTNHVFFIPSSVDGPWGCFCVLAIVCSATVNTGVHVPVWIRAVSFSGCMPRSGIAGLDSNSVFSFFNELLYCSS